MKRLWYCAVFSGVLSVAGGQVTYDFNSSNGGWSGTGDWTWNSSSGAWATGGVGAYITTFTLTSPTLVVSSSGNVTGSFSHRFYFETARDGGHFRYSVNGGAWLTVPQGLISGQSYNVSMGGSGPITGTMAFSNQSSGWSTPSYLTSDFTLGTSSADWFTAGDQIQFRFVGAWDDSVLRASPNWEITSLVASNVSVVPEPSSYAALVGIGALALAGWQTRRYRINSHAVSANHDASFRTRPGGQRRV